MHVDIERPAQPPAALPDDVARVLGLQRRRPWLRAARWLLGAAALAAGALALATLRSPEEDGPRWVTARVARGDLTVIARAAGTLEPVDTVRVGAEVSGRIAAVHVDVNDAVARGQVLARLDTETFENALAQAEAGLAVASAAADRARASVMEARAEDERLRGLAGRGVVTQHELEAARAANLRAAADLASAQAQERLARVHVDQARTDLAKAVIRSPIDGVVLTRDVEPGNTIVASFQAPELFTLASPLSSLRLRVAVDEADVGHVASGQRAAFTVDAWPGQELQALVLRVHLAPTVEENVVTYAAELLVDDAAGPLRPGMTAAATIVTGARAGALLVPNVALRFTPPAAAAARGFQLGPPRGERRHASGAAVWVLRDGAPARVAVTTGATDGQDTEVLDGLAEGDEVLVGVEQGAP